MTVPEPPVDDADVPRFVADLAGLREIGARLAATAPTASVPVAVAEEALTRP